MPGFRVMVFMLVWGRSYAAPDALHTLRERLPSPASGRGEQTKRER
ncbi:exported hypothetical protein [Cupriavidus oxalaticus]|uniref:Uncharacterized protein n=1 Tax=Cupriavidus oxalaticus TaxID=96344 RepID=A0A375FUD4_9BURK|nr:exported hypothetical protein [Cupriavidus oxalaticus]